MRQFVRSGGGYRWWFGLFVTVAGLVVAAGSGAAQADDFYPADPGGNLVGQILRPLDAGVGAEAGLRPEINALIGTHGFDLVTGDINGDSYADVVVGYPSAGQVRIYFGGSHAPYPMPGTPAGVPPLSNPVTTDIDPADYARSIFTDPPTGFVDGRVAVVGPPNRRFGFSVALGFVNAQDGCPDIIIGGPGPEDGTQAGGLYVVFNDDLDPGLGVQCEIDADSQQLSPDDAVLEDGTLAPIGSRLGWDVAAYPVGGSNDNVLVSAPRFGTPQQANLGAVVELRYDGAAFQTEEIETGTQVDQQFGESLAVCDLNAIPNDPLDVVIGATNPGSEGQAWIYSSGLNDLSPGDLGGSAGILHSDNDYFGFSVACGNFVVEGGPQIDEVAVGSVFLDVPADRYGDNLGRNNAGAVYVFRGPTAASLAPIAAYFPQNTGDQAGYSLAAGDLGDAAGAEELLVGVARWDDNTDPFPDPNPNECGGRSNRGAVFAVNPPDTGALQEILLTLSPLAPSVVLAIEGERCDQLGRSIAVGDWNFDGWSEVFTGSGTDPNEQTFGTENDPGTVWIFTSNDSDLDGAGNVRDPDDDAGPSIGTFDFTVGDCFADAWETGGAPWEGGTLPLLDPTGVDRRTGPFEITPNLEILDINQQGVLTPGGTVTYSFTVTLSCGAVNVTQDIIVLFDVGNLGIGNDFEVSATQPPAESAGDEVVWRVQPSQFGSLPPAGNVDPTTALSTQTFAVQLSMALPVDSPEDPTGDGPDPLDPDDIVNVDAGTAALPEFRTPFDSVAEVRLVLNGTTGPFLEEARDDQNQTGIPALEDNIADRENDDASGLTIVGSIDFDPTSCDADCVAPGPGCCHPGDDIAYTLDLWNTGNQDSGRAELVVELPDDFVFGSIDPTPLDINCAQVANQSGACGGTSTAQIRCEVLNIAGDTNQLLAPVSVTIRGTLQTLPGGLDPALTDLINEACITVDAAGSDVAPDDVLAIVNPAFDLTSSCLAGECRPNTTLEYTLDLSNAGSATAGPSETILVLPADVTLDGGSVPAGCVADSPAPNQVACAIPAIPTTAPGNLTRVIQGTINNGIPFQAPAVELTAIGTFFVDGDSTLAEVTLPAAVTDDAQVPNLAATLAGQDQTGGPPLEINDTVQYQIAVGNTGNGSATGVTVTADIPANTTFVTASAGGVQVGSTVQWTGQVIPVSQTLNLTFDVTVDLDTPDATVISSQASVTYAEFTGNIVLSNQLDLVVAAPDLTLIVGPAGVCVGGADVGQPCLDRPSFCPGSICGPQPPVYANLGQGTDVPITYLLEIANSGGGSATDLTILDPVPASTSYVPASISGTGADDSNPLEMQWSGATLPGGTSTVLSFQVSVDPAALPGDLIENQAQLDYAETSASPARVSDSSDVEDNDPAELGNNPADPNDDDTTKDQVPALRANMSSTDVNGVDLENGDEIEYVTVLTNLGPEAVTNIELRNPIPEDTTYVAATAVATDLSDVPLPPLVSNVTFDIPTKTVIWTLTDLAGSGGGAKLTFRSDVDNGTKNNTIIANTATVTYDQTYSPAQVSLVSDDPLLSDGTEPVPAANNPTNPNDDDPTQDQVSAPAISISKSATDLDTDGDGILGPNDTIEYVVTLTNDGGSKADNIALVDMIPANTTYVGGSAIAVAQAANAVNLVGNELQWVIVFLNAVGQNTATLTFRVTVDAFTPDTTVIENQATLTFDQGGANTFYSDSVDPADDDLLDPDGDGDPFNDDSTKDAVSSPDVAGVKASVEFMDDDGVLKPGDTIGYTVTLTNNGAGTASNLVLEDIIAAGSTYIGGSASATDDLDVPLPPLISNITFDGADPDGPTLTWTLTELPGGTTVKLQFGADVDLTTPDATDILNTATFLYDEIVVVRTTNTTTETVVAPNITPTKLSAEVGDDDGILKPTDTIGYRVTLVNNGAGTANNLVLEDIIPTNTTYVAASAVATDSFDLPLPPLISNITFDGADPDGPTLTWTLTELAGGATEVKLDFLVTVDPATPDLTNIQNVATFDFDELIGTDSTNTTLDVVSDPLVLGTISATDLNLDADGVLGPNDTLEYVVTLTNSGIATVTNIALTNLIPANTTYVGGSASTVAQAVNVVNLVGNELQWSIVFLNEVGQNSATLTYRVTVDSGTADLALIENQATYTLNEGGATVFFTDSTDPADDDPLDPNNNGDLADDDTTKDLVAAPAGVALKSSVEFGDDDGILKPTDILEYTITLANNGTGVARNILLEDIMPADGNYVGGSALATDEFDVPLLPAVSNVSFDGADPDGPTLTWTLTDLAAGGTLVKLTFRVEVDAATGDGATLQNQATLIFDEIPVPVATNLTSDVVSLPFSLPRVEFTSSDDLSWTVPEQGSSPTFSLYRNDLSTLAGTGIYIQDPSVPEVDLWCGLAGSTHFDPMVPAVGEGVYYLLGMDSGGGTGSLGVDSLGNERQSGLAENGCP